MPPVQQAPEYDAEFIAQQFGLNEAEALQMVSYGEQGSSPLWKVLMDDRCPVGGWVKTAHIEGGREAVESKLKLFNQLSPEFQVALGEDAKKK